MQTPLQITFRDMESSAAVEENIREKAGRLEQFYDQIMSCRVMVEAPHGHHHQGRSARPRGLRPARAAGNLGGCIIPVSLCL